MSLVIALSVHTASRTFLTEQRERFTTGRSGRGATAGTGLGRALVAEPVAAHGDEVRCT